MTGTRETAAQLDNAIDSLLRGPDGPRPDGAGELAATARVLREALPRLHPSFRFEELLAARLAAARRMLVEGAPLPAPTPIRADITVAEAAPLEDHESAQLAEAAERRRRSLVAGGAIASGVSLALPIAGAAIVAWRRSRSSGGLF